MHTMVEFEETEKENRAVWLELSQGVSQFHLFLTNQDTLKTATVTLNLIDQ